MPNNQSKIIIFAFDKNQLTLAEKMRLDIAKNNKQAFIITYPTLQSYNKDYVKPLKYYQDKFDIKYHDILKITHSAINSFGENIIDNNISFSALTNYNGVSLWEMSKQYLLSELVPLFKNFYIVFKILESERPSEVIILPNSEKIGEIFSAVCAHMKIRYLVFKPKKVFWINTFIRSYILTAENFIRKIYRLCKSLYHRLLNRINSLGMKYDANGVVIFFNYIERNLDAIIPVIKQYNTEQRLVINMPQSECERCLRKHGIVSNYFYGYKSYKIFDIKTTNFSKDTWAAINNSTRFKDQIICQNINIWNLLKDTFRYLIFDIFPEKIYFSDSVKEIILSNNTKAVVIMDYANEIILPAKDLSIPTITILPSSIGELLYFGDVCADYATITGPDWKKTLLKLEIKPENVKVIGPTKYDAVSAYNFYRDDILKELGLSSDKKTILYAGAYTCESMGYSYAVYIREIEMVFKALKKFNDTNIIIKMHPYDSNFHLYKKIAKQEGMKNIKLIKNSNIWKLLCCSDVVITYFSTVSYEAIIMDKPVIVLSDVDKYYSNEDLWTWDFKETKPVLFIDDFLKLDSAIKVLLYNKEAQLSLREARIKYISGHASPMDGMSSNRAKQFIQDIAEHNEKKDFSEKTHTLCASLHR